MIRGLFQRNKQDSPRQLARDAEKLGGAAKAAIDKGDNEGYARAMRDILGKAESLLNLEKTRGIDNSERRTVAASIRGLMQEADKKGLETPFMIDKYVTEILNVSDKPQSL